MSRLLFKEKELIEILLLVLGSLLFRVPTATATLRRHATTCHNEPWQEFFLAQAWTDDVLPRNCQDCTVDRLLCELRDAASGRQVKQICQVECLSQCKMVEKIGTLGVAPAANDGTTRTVQQQQKLSQQQRRRRGSNRRRGKQRNIKAQPKAGGASSSSSANKTPQNPNNANKKQNHPPKSLPPTASPTSSLPFLRSMEFFHPKNVQKLPVLPEPHQWNKNVSRTNCPHLPGTSTTSSGHHTDTLLDWHNLSTWSTLGHLPGPLESVTLPENASVILRESIPYPLGYVTIPPQSTLMIGESVSGINLTVQGIVVLGRLLAGSTTCRIETPISITLQGTRPVDVVQNIPFPKVKGINVRGQGVLSLHGKRYFSTWTRLAHPVQAGDTTVYLQQSVNWEPGQQIVLVTSSVADARTFSQNEVRTVSQVEQVSYKNLGAIVTLTEPVQYNHTANQYYQVEVGLLSRMITVQGSELDSLPTDPETFTCTAKSPSALREFNWTVPCMNTELTGYGGHIIISQEGTGQLEGVELLRMGQTNVLGRYPIHFDQLGTTSNSYVSDSSIHQSYYRCVGIHGTNNVTVTENVAYDIMGHCYYLETGYERYNTFSFNLGAYIHMIGPSIPSGKVVDSHVVAATSNVTMPADVTASAFFISNVRNNLIGNAASGVRMNLLLSLRAAYVPFRSEFS